ncbi:MAG: hypothetical protein ACRDGN_02805 [bacterium]
MSTEEDGREETPRVVRRLRVARRTDTIRPLLDPQRGALRAAEQRFLSLQRAAAARPSTEVVAEYLAILGDLRQIDEQLREASGRRDIPFIVDRRLTFLNEHCRWLTRRVSAEVLLVLEIHLEQEVKRVIAPEAYQVFLLLEEVEDTAREIEMLSDRELMVKLREGTLVREILEQVRLSPPR